ncbi:hypothetical protein ACI77O_12950 [Pseudomonas tritici]|uniref:hypothetical protein n=1 Tax=Pseudomonas tritici TaxID=2745518 RepID=UPI00387B4C88
MFGKQTSKDELSKLLEAKREQALFLDHTIVTVYASQPTPAKTRYKPRKKAPDAFQAEIAKLQKSDEHVTQQHPAGLSSVSVEVVSDLDVSSLEAEVASIMRSRRRK